MYCCLYILRECDGARGMQCCAGEWDGGGVLVVSAGYVGGTCIVSSAADVLGMRVVRGTRGIGGACEMCVFGSGLRRSRGW